MRFLAPTLALALACSGAAPAFAQEAAKPQAESKAVQQSKPAQPTKSAQKAVAKQTKSNKKAAAQPKKTGKKKVAQLPDLPGLGGLQDLDELLGPGGGPSGIMGQLMPLLFQAMPLIQQMMHSNQAAPVMQVRNGSIYILRGNELFRLDAKTLAIKAHVTLPGGGGLGGRIGFGLPLDLLLRMERAGEAAAAKEKTRKPAEKSPDKKK